MRVKAFTLIELLVVIFILAILSTLMFSVFQDFRVRARDAQRMADVKQIQLALELFYNNNSSYPNLDTWNSGSISDSSNVYMSSIPYSSLGGICNEADYQYLVDSNLSNYLLYFCLEKDYQGSHNKGYNTINNTGSFIHPNLLAWWSFDGNFRDLTLKNDDAINHGGEIVNDETRGEVLYLNGQASYLYLGDMSFLNQEKTLSFWIKPVVKNTEMRIISNANNIRFSVRYYFDKVQVWGSTWKSVIDNPDDIDTWSHYTFVFYGDGYVKAYMNGIPYGHELVNESFSELVLGAPLNFAHGAYVHAYFDNLQIYDKAMSDDEVLFIYNNY